MEFVKVFRGDKVLHMELSLFDKAIQRGQILFLMGEWHYIDLN